MVKLFCKTLSFLSRKESSILHASTIIMLTVFFSRILGLLRDRMLASRFTPSELGIYYASFRLPNMIFELLVMGALVTAFIPVFTSTLSEKGKKEAFQMASSVINIGLIVFLVFSFPLFLFVPQISSFLAPGFSKDEISLMASFTRIMLLAQVFPLILGNFFTGILQSFRNFVIPALAPIIYNFGIILGIILFSPAIGLYAPVFGVVLGALFFAAVQFPYVLKFGYRHLWLCNINDSGVREIGRLMIPRTIGLAIAQIDATIDLVLSALLGATSVTIFSFAQHLQQLPIGLFGASIAQAAFPMLASNSSEKNREEFKKMFLSSFQQILFFVIPLSSILIVLRIPLVRLVFGASVLFDWKTTVATGKTLAFFSLSLFAQSLIHLLARAFYALHDTKTPVKVGIISVLLNTIFSVIFVLYYRLEVWALGLSTSIASIFQMVVLLLLLDKKIDYFNRRELFLPPIKIFLAGLVSGIALYIPIKLLDRLVFDTTRTINLLILTGIASLVGLMVYLFFSWFLEVPQVKVFFTMFEKAKRFKRGVMMDATSEVVDIQETKI